MTATASATRPAPVPQGAPRAFPGIPFRTLNAVEWRKATDTRSARWLLAFSGLAAILIMLAPLLARHSIDQTYSQYLQFPAMVLASLLPVVSILTLTSEWSQRSVLATFTQEPRRSRVIAAKVAVSVQLSLLATVFGAVVTAAALGLAAATGRDLSADLGAANVAGYVLFLIVNILMGVAFGALLHNSPAAIVAFFLLPTAFGFLGAAVDSVGRWIDPSRTFGWLAGGDLGGHVPQILVSALLWLVAPLTIGLVRTARREVS